MAIGSVVGDLNDSEYINWFKANRAMHYTIVVLRGVCLVEVTKFHKFLVNRHGNKTCTVCTHAHVKKKTWCTWSINCPLNVCSAWLDDIVDEKTADYTQLTWKNSTFSEWQTEPWQIAKIYMNSGQPIAAVKPDDTDAAGIIQLLQNFKGLQGVLDKTNVDAVSLYPLHSSQCVTYLNTLLCHIDLSQVILCYSRFV